MRTGPRKREGVIVSISGFVKMEFCNHVVPIQAEPVDNSGHLAGAPTLARTCSVCFNESSVVERRLILLGRRVAAH